MGNLIYRPLIEDMVWSYSRIKCFDDCPYRFFLKYIKGYKDFPQFYSSYGSFMHKLIEMFYKGEISKEEMCMRFLFDFQNEVKGVRPSAKTVQKYIQSGVEYLKKFKPFPFNMIAVEEKVEFYIKDFRFIGFIDYVGEKDGEIYIVDNKSRDLKPRSAEGNTSSNDEELDKMLRQMYLYSAAIKQRFGKYPKALCFNCFKNNTFILEPFNEAAYLEAIQWAENRINEIKNTDEFAPCLNYFGCFYICGVSDVCRYWKESG